MTVNIKELAQRFFADPQWGEMEELILGYIEPLIDMSTVDVHQPAEHVKAEIIGRIKAYESLSKFLKDTKIITRPIKEFKNPFV